MSNKTDGEKTLYIRFRNWEKLMGSNHNCQFHFEQGFDSTLKHFIHVSNFGATLQSCIKKYIIKNQKYMKISNKSKKAFTLNICLNLKTLLESIIYFIEIGKLNESESLY